MMALPLIFDIRHGSMDDGPGIRTTVFFKGCPLSCIWCHNPESMRLEAEIIWDFLVCAGCNACSMVCPTGALEVSQEVTFHREICTACGACAVECPSNARRPVGKQYPVEELVRILLLDKGFYRSTGGVTFSGGEPTLHVEYLSMVLQALKKENISTALQTCGAFDIEIFRRHLLPYLDLVYFDLKLCDSASHMTYTGFGNEQLLTNFSALSREIGEKLVPRVPLVPGITATELNLTGIASFLRELGITSCQLLPFNPEGIEKRRLVGHPVPPGISVSFMELNEERRLRELFRSQLQL
jgi:pyruvate formate lyase activating enzyme